MVSEFLDRLARILGSRAKLAEALGISTSTLKQWYRRQSIPWYGFDLLETSKALPFISYLSVITFYHSSNRYPTLVKAQDKQVKFHETYKDQATLIAELVADLPKYKDKLRG